MDRLVDDELAVWWGSDEASGKAPDKGEVLLREIPISTC